MNTIVFLVSSLFLLGLGALYSLHVQEKTTLISHFETNESERVEKIAWCKDSFERLERSDCKNALEAEKRTQEKTEELQ